ncbi:hypothetical protein BGX21_002037 [Mortierella sp. AD011]|nr:hypothetical protein BGX21_002037 [Mortierella sp. AD011]
MGKQINGTLQEMNAVDIAQLIDKMRVVERKMGLVYTLFKSSVYAVTQQMQEQEQEEEEGEEEQQEQEMAGQQQQEQFSSLQYHQDQIHRSLQGQGENQTEQDEQHQQHRLSQQHTYELNNNIDNNALRSSQSRSTTPSTRAQTVLRVSNANAARGDFQSEMSNAKSALSLSRGYGSSRWSQGAIRDSDSQTNRPRYY